MRRWQTRPLGETCAINPKLVASEAPAADAEVTFVPMAAVDEVSGTIARPELRQYRQVAKGYTPFRENDVLFAKITPCMQNGKAAIARGLRGGLGFGSTEFHVLRPSPGLLPQWVFAFVRQPSFRAAAEANFTGTAGQQRVPADFLRSFPIPVPPLREQERIVKLLDQADELRKVRAQADRRTDALIPALFHDMFGDPISNPIGWPLAKLSEIAPLKSGYAFKSTDYCAEGVRLVRISNLDGQNLVFDEGTVYLPESFLHEYPPFQLAAGDVLIAMSGATTGKLGMVRSDDVPSLLNQRVGKFFIRDASRIEPTFLFSTLGVPAVTRKLIGEAAGSAQANVSPSGVGSVEIPVPPLPMQKEFAQRVTEICELEAAQAASRQRLEALFQSMLHRAFNGEL
jgi:type I restriction enzyme, S subunit